LADPLVTAPSAFCFEAGMLDFGVMGVRPLGRRRKAADFGLRLRVLALFSRSESGSCSSAMAEGEVARLAAERVMGAKYVPAFSPLSEGVGEGEVTRGVPGIWYCCDMAEGRLGKKRKGAKTGALMRPKTSCVRI